jgi:cytochrome c oxidase subunit 2
MRFRVIALAPREYNEWLDQQMQTARNVAASAADVNRPKAQLTALRKFKTNEPGISDKFEVEPLKAWLAKQAPEKGEDAALIAKGKDLFLGKATCSQCHSVRGHGAAGVLGPDLTHVGARSTIAAGLIENNREQLHRWIHDPGSVKPGNKMAKGYAERGLKLSLEEEHALIAYLESLK